MPSLKNIMRRNRPINQNIVTGMLLFCLPGIYTAITGLGAGGGRSSSGVVANQSNSILYGMFTLFGCLGGPIVNLFGVRISMLLGMIGYPLYVGGMWYYDRTGITWFPLFGGAMIGLSVGVLLTCAGMIAFSYSTERTRGLYICLQWMIRAIGATVAASIAFGMNAGETKAVGVSSSVYIAFICIECCSLLLIAFLLVEPKNVVRDDGTHIAKFKPTTVVQELKKLGLCFIDKKLLLLVPATLGCEMSLSLVSTVNVYRKKRGIMGVAITGAIAIGGCIGMYIWLHITGYASYKKTPAYDWSYSHYGGFMVIYLMFGLTYSSYALTVEWVFACLSNDPAVLAHLYVTGVAGMIWVLIFIVPETNYFKEENTIAPQDVQEDFVTHGKITQEQLDQEVEKDKIASVGKADDRGTELTIKESL
ncbi:hypothetical protein LTS07_006259 [Exophiala sideris]|uniref:Major facilitator superfamily (MFS) profile domain-containing protein n=1 Tax=Exophiala sideris TaxID=1016849 RepID=A0ABR0J6G5_9EURO|nr:hypothetical protein LTS07_006259 [Exophiala sideris]KAK5035748.1 hypothetical protein LTR13_005878 [Exophiala sideris]KAK5057383.1 hypothetical protein LTR69_007423 [Exophiala sideris]